MIKVEFLGPIGIDPISLDVTNLTEVANELKKNEEVAKWLDNSAVAVNDMMVSSLDVELKDGDKVSLLPPVCGG